MLQQNYLKTIFKQSYDKDLEELDKTFNTGFNGIENM